MNTASRAPNQEPLQRAISILSSLKALAAEEEWEAMQQVVARLRIAIAEVPPDQRADIVNAAATSIESLRTSVMSAKLNTADKLADIRTGRVATRAYSRSP